MTCPLPFGHFIDAFLKDIGVTDPFTRIGIELKLSAIFTTYNANKPDTSISQIADELYDCLSSTLSDAQYISTQLAAAIFFVILATAIFILLIAMVSYIVKSSAIIWLWIAFFILYLITVLFILYIVGLNISNKTTQDSIIIRNCVNEAITQLNNFATDTEQAIQDGLCAY